VRLIVTKMGIIKKEENQETLNVIE